jgi:DNA-binding winged helix-turn-helix (wHTH) protein
MSNFAWLTGRLADGQSIHWILRKDALTIGRDEPADFVLSLPRISRQHARLTRQEKIYYLADLGSRNGTFVNGKPVGEAPQRLADGDEIVLAGVMILRFHDPNETITGPRLGRLHGVWINEASHETWVDGRNVNPPLSAPQFTLLSLLYDSPGQVISRAQIIAAVWPEVDPAGVSEEAVDGLIKRLRARLREVQPDREYIEVVRGYGLRLNEPEQKDQ